MEGDAAASSSAAPHVDGGGSDDRQVVSRQDYLTRLLSGRAPSLRLESSKDDDDDDFNDDTSTSVTSPPKPSSPTRSELSRRFTSMRASLRQLPSGLDKVEVRMHNYSYHVPINVEVANIKTVINQSPCYAMTTFMINVGELFTGKRKVKDILGHHEKKWILQDINLVLKPGKTYLVMGPPSCGKTSLLKAVAGLLKKEGEGGKIDYNGVSREVSNRVHFFVAISKN